MILNAIMILIGLSGGIVVGSGLVAILTVLDIIPRLAQVAGIKKLQPLEWSIILGAIMATAIDLFEIKIEVLGENILVFIVGSFAGIFVGLLAAALTEVLNVIPILAKRVGLTHKLLTLLMAMVIGKVLGSLFDWLIFIKP